MRQVTILCLDKCPPCVTSKLALERLQQLYPSSIELKIVNLGAYSKPTHMEKLMQAYEDNSLVVSSGEMTPMMPQIFENRIKIQFGIGTLVQNIIEEAEELQRNEKDR